MTRFLPLLAALAAGCSSSAPLGPASTPEKAKTAITAALDGWKAGGTPASLSAGSPAIVLNDDAFARGVKLLEYAVVGEPAVVGTGLTFTVNLKIQDGSKPAASRKVQYRVVTDPNINVTKEDTQS